ncbi:MAG: hypothetical protein AB1781_06110 [Pseudomonadota bacterium]
MMRNRTIIVLGLFLASVLLNAAVVHCVPGLDAFVGVKSAAAAETHGSGPAHHQDNGSGGQDCVVSDVRTLVNLQSVSPAPAPTAKALVVRWPLALLAYTASGHNLRSPNFGAAARGSPSYAAVFARTGRLLI